MPLFGLTPTDFTQQTGGGKPPSIQQGFRPDGSFGVIAGSAPSPPQGGGGGGQQFRSKGGLGGVGQPQGGGAVFTPTASGLFADASQPFGGQSVAQRLQGKQNLLGGTGQTGGGVAGSQKFPAHPFMS